MITQKKIAEMARVSRGTVDRVLNGRGSVKTETERQVRKVLEEVGYKPNKAGKGLAAIRKPVQIGILLASEGNRFFDEVIAGINDAAAQLLDFGVEVRMKTTKGYDVGRQLELIKELCACQVSGIAIAPINDPRISLAIDHAIESGIRVAAVNQDILGSRRDCYIGSNYVKSGEIAAGLFHLIRRSEPVKIGIVTGTRKMMGHSQRIFGFEKVVRSEYLNLEICAVVENDDDEDRSYALVKELIARHPDLSGFYFAAAGVSGGVRAICECGKRDSTIISCDRTSGIVEFVREGVIDATIGQQPYEQGCMAINTLFDMIVNGEDPKKEFIYVKNEIFLKENI